MVSGTPKTITGIFARIKNSNKKPTRIVNLNVDDIDFPTIPIVFKFDTDTYTGITDYGEDTISIAVTNEDSVTVTIIEPV